MGPASRRQRTRVPRTAIHTGQLHQRRSGTSTAASVANCHRRSSSRNRTGVHLPVHLNVSAVVRLIRLCSTSAIYYYYYYVLLRHNDSDRTIQLIHTYTQIHPRKKIQKDKNSKKAQCRLLPALGPWVSPAEQTPR